MMMTKTIKSNFDIKTLNSLVINNLSQFLNYFNINLQEDNKKYYGPCPIHHNADNPQGLILYKNTGIWMCNTHHCEQTFQKSAVGFIRGLLSAKKRGWTSINDKYNVSSINDTNNFILKILNKTYEELVPLKQDSNNYNDKSHFIRQSRLLNKNTILYDIDTYKVFSICPSDYFLSRKLSTEIIKKYLLGTLKDETNIFYNREVVPLIDHSGHFIIGLTARINHPYCLLCNTYHPVNQVCLDKSKNKTYSKWEHTPGFDKRQYLFNYSFSKECINTSGKIIIVEGPLDAIKLDEAGICYSVALLGSSLSKEQATFIKKCHINTVYIATDNDEGGLIAKDSIIKNLGNKYKYVDVEISKNDIAELTIEEIKELFNENG